MLVSGLAGVGLAPNLFAHLRRQDTQKLCVLLVCAHFRVCFCVFSKPVMSGRHVVVSFARGSVWVVSTRPAVGVVDVSVVSFVVAPS